MRRRRPAGVWIFGTGIVLGLSLGCSRPAERTDHPAERAVASNPVTARLPPPASDPSRFAVDNSFPGVREPHVGKGSTSEELLVAATSAYNAGLFVDDDAIYLLTDRVAYRFVVGASPQRIPLENGSRGTVTRSALVYWSQGAIWQVPRTGGRARRLAALQHEPQQFVAAADDFAWLDMPERDQFLIQTLDRRRVRTLVDYAGRIETAAMAPGRVYFVRRDGDSAWRIGSVSTHGGEPTYAAPKTGPTPSKLAVAGDVFYYDLPSGEVRRLSADLSREETMIRDLICSPLAVSVRIYCPNMDGMFELAQHRGAKPLPLFPSRERITAVAASSRYLAWLKDPGADRLSLNMIRLVLDDAP
jgi:hypothetical protein